MANCNNDESEVCKKCKDRICSKVPVIRHILASGDRRKIARLTGVMARYELKVQSYL